MSTKGKYVQEALMMMSKREAQSISSIIPYHLAVKIDSLAKREECSRSDVVRTALLTFFKLLNEEENNE